MIRTLLAISILLSSARADTHLVSQTGPSNFRTITSALVVANDGDLILVAPGDYAGFQVDNRSITIAALDDQALPRMTTPNAVLNLSPTQTVVLSGLNLVGGGTHSLTITNCSGAVRIQDCLLSSPSESTSSPSFRRAVLVESSANAVLTSCRVSALDNHISSFEDDFLLSAIGSQVALAQSEFIGRQASCLGGTTVNLDGSSFLFASACDLRGGDGFSFSCDCGFLTCGGSGGDGVRIGSTPGPSTMLLHGTTLIGGIGGIGSCDGFNPCDGQDGSPFAGLPSLPATVLPGVPRTSSYAATVFDGAALLVSADGAPGDQVTLVLSKQPIFDTTAAGTGVRLFQPGIIDPMLHREFALGTLTGSSLGVSVTLPPNGANLRNETWFAQTVFTDVSQNIWYGPGRSISVHEPLFGSDFNQLCQGDGGDQMGCTNCPCSNNAPFGSSGGCFNSAGRGTQLFASGNTSVSLPPSSSNDLRFGLVDAPAGAFCVLTSGDSVAPTNPMSVCFGMNSGVQAMQFDGLRCAVSNTRRHGGRSADMFGSVGFSNAPWGGTGGPPVGIAQAGGGFASGQTRYFQVFHRDDPSLSCMRGLNTSQATEIQFTP